MTYTVKCMKLDYLLLKPYFKSMMLVLLVPLMITFFTGTLFEGLSFAATVMAMTTGYAFSVAEKNNLSRFYGFLPIKKIALVKGRYLIIFLMGLISLTVTLAVQVVILSMKRSLPDIPEIVGNFLLCAVLFCIYAGVQIPGYYRYGSIKGKMFMFIPTVGFLLFYYIIRMFTEGANTATANVSLSPIIIVIIALGSIALLISVSALVSAKIVEKKGL